MPDCIVRLPNVGDTICYKMRSCDSPVEPDREWRGRVMMLKYSGYEAVANAPYSINLFSECTQFLAQAGDVVVYGAVKAQVVVAPDLLQEDFAFEDPAGMGDEQHEQVVFFRG